MEKLSPNEIKRIRSLSQKKFRDETGLFTVEGEKMVEEALRSGFSVEKVFYRDDIGEEAMSRISSFSSPSPALAVLHQRSCSADDILAKTPDGLFLALDAVRDPGNLGTILRIADWFGIDGVFASPDTVELYNPKVIQSTMGAVFRVPFAVTDIPELCRRFRSEDRSIYGTLLDGNDIYLQSLRSSGLIVMGNESAGISPAVRDMVTDRLLIPSFAKGDAHAESLNVAIATAATVAEFKRRSR